MLSENTFGNIKCAPSRPTSAQKNRESFLVGKILGPLGDKLLARALVRRQFFYRHDSKMFPQTPAHFNAASTDTSVEVFMGGVIKPPRARYRRRGGGGRRRYGSGLGSERKPRGCDGGCIMRRGCASIGVQLNSEYQEWR